MRALAAGDVHATADEATLIRAAAACEAGRNAAA
jgi:hypothetical protein